MSEIFFLHFVVMSIFWASVGGMVVGIKYMDFEENGGVGEGLLSSLTVLSGLVMRSLNIARAFINRITERMS